MMEDFDDTVAAPEEKERGSKVGLIGVLVGVVGIVVGVTGIVLANQAQNAVKALEARLAAQPDKSAEVQQAVDDLNGRLEKLGAEFVKLGRADRQIQESTQAGFTEVAGSVRANREALNELSGKLAELVGKLENWTPTTRVASSGGSGGSGGEAVEAVPEEGVYLIQSGDTLSKIAGRFGVSLSALMAANPTVDPKRLQIGQRIVIPKP